MSIEGESRRQSSHTAKRKSSEMSSASPAPATGKPILIQILRDARPEEEDICREAENRFRKLKPDSSIYNYSNDKFFPIDEFGPQQTNAWFIIRDTSKGPRISEIFHGLPQDEPIHSREGTNCVFVGSHLYDIGGRGSTRTTMDRVSNKILRLDTKNPHHGWESETLPFNSERCLTTVSGKFIYFFNPVHIQQDLQRKLEQNGEHETPPPWAYMYDTIEKASYKIKHPDNQIQVVSMPPLFCLPLENVGVLVAVEEDKKYGGTDLYVHKFDQREWELIYRIECPPTTRWNPYEHLEAPISDFRYKPQAISATTYFVRLGSYLLAYNINPWKFRGCMWLPRFDKDYTQHNVFMVVVADCELCFLWHEKTCRGEKITLNYVKILVSFEPAPTTTLMLQAQFQIDAEEVINCLPYAPDGQNQCEEEKKVNLPFRMSSQTKGRKQKREKLDMDLQQLNVNYISGITTQPAKKVIKEEEVGE